MRAFVLKRIKNSVVLGIILFLLCNVNAFSTRMAQRVRSTSSNESRAAVLTSSKNTGNRKRKNVRRGRILPVWELSQSARSVDGDERKSSAFRQQYTKWMKEYYLIIAAIQSGTIAFLADIITQKMKGRGPIDYSHVLAMVAVAATASGSFNAYWLRKIEGAFPGRARKDVFVKAMISTLLLGGAINAGYILGIPLFSSTIFAPSSPYVPLDPRVWFAGWTNDAFITLTKVECIMFLPYHLLAFNLVPPQLRPLTQAFMAGTFNVIVSAVTLGFFKSWMAQVAAVINGVLSKII